MGIYALKPLRIRPRAVLAALIGGAAILVVVRVVSDCGNVGDPRSPGYVLAGGAS
jgi:hypothetical protein